MARNRLPSLLIGLIIIEVGSFGCARDSFAPPTAPGFADTPAPATAVRLLSEFKSNEVTAAYDYLGKRLYFQNVTVEIAKPATRNDPDAYFISDGVIFKPRYTSDLDTVIEGTVLDVVGEVRGYMASVLVIGDCWVKITGGQTGAVSPGY